jgi:thiol-disulfide isomerase/thioredoxin
MASSGALVQAQVIDTSETLLTPIATDPMGRSLLIEEVTTTWCPTCAQIDPYLMGVADSHGSRITMVAYHPSDGEDAFQPPAAQHRIDRLGIHHGGAIPSPTFFVEGKNPRSGTDAWNDVQRDILELELTRQDTSTLQFEVVRNENGITARLLSFETNIPEFNDSQLTFLVLEHQKTVPTGFVNPGEKTRDRVLVATAECEFNTSTIKVQFELLNADVDEGCGTDFQITFAYMDEFSILLLHESTEDAIVNSEAPLGTYGAVEFAYRSRLLPQSSWSLVSIALFIAAAAGLMAIVPRKN